MMKVGKSIKHRILWVFLGLWSVGIFALQQSMAQEVASRQTSENIDFSWLEFMHKNAASASYFDPKVCDMTTKKTASKGELSYVHAVGLLRDSESKDSIQVCETEPLLGEQIQSHVHTTKQAAYFILKKAVPFKTLRGGIRGKKIFAESEGLSCVTFHEAILEYKPLQKYQTSDASVMHYTRYLDPNDIREPFHGEGHFFEAQRLPNLKNRKIIQDVSCCVGGQRSECRLYDFTLDYDTYVQMMNYNFKKNKKDSDFGVWMIEDIESETKAAERVKSLSCKELGDYYQALRGSWTRVFPNFGDQTDHFDIKYCEDSTRKQVLLKTHLQLIAEMRANIQGLKTSGENIKKFRGPIQVSTPYVPLSDSAGKFTLDLPKEWEQNIDEALLVGFVTEDKKTKKNKKRITHVGSVIFENGEWMLIHQSVIKGKTEKISLKKYVQEFNSTGSRKYVGLNIHIRTR